MAYKTSRNNCRASRLYLKRPPAPVIDPMEKSKIISELHEMINHRLFGTGPWLTDSKDYQALNQRLDDLGLQERYPGDDDAKMPTVLGEEVDLELIMLFLGLWHIMDVPMVLQDYDFIDDDESDLLFAAFCSVSAVDPDKGDPEAGAILRPIIQQAYQVHYNQSEA